MAELLFNDFVSMTDGERETAEILKEGLPDRWAVVCNKVLPAPYSSREIDFIVIGDQLVYAIDEKSWRGRITGTDEIWVRRERWTRSPLNKIDMVAKYLADYIRDKTAHVRDINGEFVLGCVSLTRSTERPAVSDPRIQSRVFLISDVCERLLYTDQLGGSKIVGDRRSDIKNSVHDLSARPKFPKQIDDYKILSRDSVIPGATICEAELIGTELTEGTERLLTVYDIPPDDPEAKDFYLQEFYAYTELAKFGVCPANVQDPKPWSDDHLVVVNRMPEGESLGKIREMKAPACMEDLSQELKMFLSVYHAIAVVHRQGLVHRALDPGNIYLFQDGDEWKTNFIGFHACRRPKRPKGSIFPILDRFEIDDPYTAPELDMGYQFAEQASDTFSVSLIFLERLTGRSPVDLKANLEELSDLINEGLGREFSDWIDVSSLEEFFVDTLGQDPPIGQLGPGTGRLSAEECEVRVNGLLQRLH